MSQKPLLSSLAMDMLYTLANVKIHVVHYRRRHDYSPRRLFPMPDIRRASAQSEIDAKGGKTVVVIIDMVRGYQWVGEAKCHENDTYNRVKGFNLAFEKALCLLRADFDPSTPVCHGEPMDVSLLSPMEKEKFVNNRVPHTETV